MVPTITNAIEFYERGPKEGFIKKKKEITGGSLYHRNLPVTFEFASSFFHISRGILVWYGNSVNHPLQLQQIAISFAATSKQYSGKCTFRVESNIARSLYIYIYVHICQYTLFLFIWRDVFRA